MNEKALYILEFDKIRAILADTAPTEGAAELALRLSPSGDRAEIKKRLSRTTDAKKLMGLKGMPSFGSVRDIRASLDRADKDAILTMRELLDIAAVMRCARALKDYARGDREYETSLDEIFSRLTVNRMLEEKITRSIISEDMMSDEASPELSDIRRKIRAANNKIKEILQKYTSGSYAKYLQENIVTTRSGRFVVPVKNEYRNEIKGLIHDTSSSGATVFIEPMSVVEANNELRELESRETHEIERILAGFSAEVSECSGEMSRNYLNITELAFIFACAELSYKMNASEPKLTDRRVIELEQARHPLLETKTIVPVTIKIGGDYSMLVITGPNTGGKTVTLKTVGLFAMMAQAGLHIPAEDSSSVCVFDEIFSDIGDEQSIEQSLSTFSSHMVGIVSIIDKMTENSLVLFDELGAGTDPVEGAALAMSILEEVRAKGALCAATTHYAELKAYAIETDGVCNASCEFDVETLKPTYRLIIGAPGKSNAFAISEKLGLPQNVVRRAANYVDNGTRSFENVIEKLEATRTQLERERDEAARLKSEYELFKSENEKALAKKLGDAERDAERMRKKAQELLDGAKATANFVMEQLEEAKKHKERDGFSQKLGDTRKAVRQRLSEYDEKVNPVEDDDKDYVLPRELKKGDEVIHRTLKTTGVLLCDPDRGGNVTVQMGIMKSRVNISQLMLSEDNCVTVTDKSGKKQKASGYSVSVSRDFKPELDVRGMTGDDAWFMIDKYLDEAKVVSVKSVTIIHGKGTGALRNAIWTSLKGDSRVKSFRAGQYGEGDYGVTVIEL